MLIPILSHRGYWKTEREEQYRRGADFVRAAESMIAKDLRVNNEFYVAPAYNEMIAEGLNRAGIYMPITRFS